MFWANCAALVSAVAKPRAAPGARSWTISSIAVPSSPLPACPGSTSTAGRSPEPWMEASESTPSDSTQTFWPAPSTPKKARAAAARCAASPSDVSTLWSSGRRAIAMRRTSFSPASASTSAIGTFARMDLNREEWDTIPAPIARSWRITRLRPLGEARSMSTSMRPSTVGKVRKLGMPAILGSARCL